MADEAKAAPDQAQWDPSQPHPLAYRDMLRLLACSHLATSRRHESAASSALLNHLLDCWRILPSMPVAIVEGALKQVLQRQDYQKLHRCWLAASTYGRAQAVATMRLTDAFEQEGLRYCLLKGAAAGLRLYASPYERTSSDVDVGVSKRDLGFATRVAHTLGYRPAQLNSRGDGFESADPHLRSKVEESHYELGFLVRRLRVRNLPGEAIEAIRAEPWAQRLWIAGDGDPWCYTIVDIHHALSLDIGLADVLDTSYTATFHAHSVTLPSDAWLAAHLIFKIYWEGVHTYGKGLYQYADMVRLAPHLSEDVFRDLRAVLERCNLEAAGHYVLRRLPLFGVELPSYVSEYIRRTSRPADEMAGPTADPFKPRFRSGDPIKLNDLGDMWARLWGHR